MLRVLRPIINSPLQKLSDDLKLSSVVLEAIAVTTSCSFCSNEIIIFRKFRLQSQYSLSFLMQQKKFVKCQYFKNVQEFLIRENNVLCLYSPQCFNR